MNRSYEKAAPQSSPRVFLTPTKGTPAQSPASPASGRCGKSPDHAGPYFTVSLIASEIGPGSRTGKKRRKRRVLRETVLRLCEECLLLTEFHGAGKTFQLRKGERPCRARKAA